MTSSFDLPHSPILRGNDRTAYRDPAAILHNGVYHLYFTLVETEEDGGVYMYLAESRSTDLHHWSEIRRRRTCRLQMW